MFDHLDILFESNNTHKKLVLRYKLQEFGTYDLDSISSYLMKLSKLRDQVATIDDPIDDK